MSHEDDVIAQDGRTDSQWYGDIGHATIERLQLLFRELLNLDSQLSILGAYADRQGLSSTVDMFGATVTEVRQMMALLRALEPSVADVVAHTGREKQSYHNYS